jgi:glycosyltransferase involved in cell wall biosynthesis
MIDNFTALRTSGLILVTNKLEQSPNGGREMLCKMNYEMCKRIYGDQLSVVELDKSSTRGLTSIVQAFRGYIDGINEAAVEGVLEEIQRKKIGQVFVDGSNLGEFVKIIKRKFPKVQIYTFFHNVESRFFLGAFKQAKTPRALAVFIVNYFAERKAVKYSDKIICLNKRDSRLLKRVYGRKATHFLPMSLKDKLPFNFAPPVRKSPEKFALFVGGLFYANQAGITWFVENVAPYIQIKTCIVGRGFEQFKEKLTIDGKVEVIGEVESLDQWYQDAHFVIAPIFDGSGMKTKVAEALMYGKKIIGTQEAFVGYEDIADRVGCVCNSAKEFITAIGAIDEVVNDTFDNELREIYKDKYSYDASTARLKIIMSSRA